MFTGIIKSLGSVVDLKVNDCGARLVVCSEFFSVNKNLFKLGDSVAVSGVCLTLLDLSEDIASFDLLSETLRSTSLGFLKKDDIVNLEPALRINQSIDGHLVSGHVDCCAEIIDVWDEPGTKCLRISMSEMIADLVCNKGSIAVEGVSLTTNGVDKDSFVVFLIPSTLVMTNLKYKNVGSRVNLEADTLARYAKRILQYQAK